MSKSFDLLSLGEVLLRLLVVMEIAVHPRRCSRCRVRVIPHFRHLRTRNAASHVRYLNRAEFWNSYFDGNVVIAVRNDHVDGLRLGLAETLHVLHGGTHRVLHEFEDHVMHVGRNVVERTTLEGKPCTNRSLFAKNTFTEGALP